MRNNPEAVLASIFNKAIDAVAPDGALLRHLRLEGDYLFIDSLRLRIPEKGITVLGAGKGAAPMALAVENLLGKNIKRGFTVVKYGHELPLDKIELAEAAHPVPDEAGEKAARKFLKIASECTADDLLLCLFTGGASALLPAPAHGLTLAELGEVTNLLLASGANIGEINAVRRHLSMLAGGQLARAANGAQILSLIVSDVIGDELETIASGPTAPDPTTFGECLAIISKYNLETRLPARALEIIQKGAQGLYPETAKKTDCFFKKVHNIIVASNGQALAAARAEADRLGMESVEISAPMCGEARVIAEKLARHALEVKNGLKKGDKNVCILAGGETTVTLTGHGMGGRNQEMALAASLALEGETGIYALFAGTDGTDGPTDAAGGGANGQVASKIGGRKRALEYLDNNDSYHALQKAGALFVTGPTRTNVMDLAIIIVEAPK